MVQILTFQPVLDWLLPYVRQGLKTQFGLDVWVSDHWPLECKPCPGAWVCLSDNGATGGDRFTQKRAASAVISGRSKTEADQITEALAVLFRALPYADFLPVCNIDEPFGGYSVENKDFEHLRALTLDFTQVGRAKTIDHKPTTTISND